MGAIYSTPPLKIGAPECSDPHFGPCSLRPSISLDAIFGANKWLSRFSWLTPTVSAAIRRGGTFCRTSSAPQEETQSVREQYPAVRLGCVLGVSSVAQLCWTLCATVAYQGSCPRFSKQEYWSGLPCPSFRESLPDPKMESVSVLSPAWQAGFINSTTWEAPHCWETSSYPISVASKKNIYIYMSIKNLGDINCMKECMCEEGMYEFALVERRLSHLGEISW